MQTKKLQETNESKIKKYQVKKYGKITRHDNDKLIELASLDYSKKEISIILGVSEKTVYNYLEKNPNLLTRIESAKRYPNLISRKTILDKVKEGDGRLALDYLKLTDKKFKPKQEIDTNVTVNSILVNIWSKNSKEESTEERNSLLDARKELPMVDNKLESAKIQEIKEGEIIK